MIAILIAYASPFIVLGTVLLGHGVMSMCRNVVRGLRAQEEL